MSEPVIMKRVGWLLLLLLVTMVTAEQCSREENGDIRIIGTDTPNLVAGRLEICANESWRAVYDENWGDTEAEIVCGGRGFPEEGIIGCRDSCFGFSSLQQGYTKFDSCEPQPNLLDCGEIAPDGHFPHDNAGVLCFKSSQDTTPPCLGACCPETPFPTSCLITPTSYINGSTCICPETTCPEVTCPTCNIPPTLDATTTIGQDSTGEQTNSIAIETCTAISALFGGLSAFLFLVLVGVVTGWVWSCHKRKGELGKKKVQVNPDEPLANPHYGSKYSNLGPQDAPSSHAAIPMVPQRQDTGGMCYEVPVLSLSPRSREEIGGDYEVPIEKRGLNYEVPTSGVDGNHYAAIPMKKQPVSYHVLQRQF